MSPSLKLYYFDFPGRAETSRNMLSYAGIPFDDVVFSHEQWPEYKAKMPFGQVPVLEVDGKQLAQTTAVDRYVAKLAKLIPEDAWEEAKMNETVAFQQEITDLLMTTMSLPDTESKVKARQEMLAGAIGEKLKKLEQMLASTSGDYFGGSQPTYADFKIFTELSLFTSGWLEGVPTDLLNSYPGLKTHHNKVGALPAVAQRYEGATEGLKLAFKVLL